MLLQMAEFHSFLYLSNIPLWTSLVTNGKKSVCNAGDLDSIPGLGRSPLEGNGYPLQDSCLENALDREAWWATGHGLQRDVTE